MLHPSSKLGLWAHLVRDRTELHLSTARYGMQYPLSSTCCREALVRKFASTPPKILWVWVATCRRL